MGEKAKEIITGVENMHWVKMTETMTDHEKLWFAQILLRYSGTI